MTLGKDGDIVTVFIFGKKKKDKKIENNNSPV